MQCPNCQQTFDDKIFLKMHEEEKWCPNIGKIPLLVSTVNLVGPYRFKHYLFNGKHILIFGEFHGNNVRPLLEDDFQFIFFIDYLREKFPLKKLDFFIEEAHLQKYETILTLNDSYRNSFNLSPSKEGRVLKSFGYYFWTIIKNPIPLFRVINIDYRDSRLNEKASDIFQIVESQRGPDINVANYISRMVSTFYDNRPLPRPIENAMEDAQHDFFKIQIEENKSRYHSKMTTPLAINIMDNFALKEIILSDAHFIVYYAGHSHTNILYNYFDALKNCTLLKKTFNEHEYNFMPIDLSLLT